MSNFVDPLVIIPNHSPQGDFGVGDLVTVTLYGGKVSGARVTRREYGNTWVTLAGLTVPRGYSIGTSLVLDNSAVIDW